MKASIDIGTNTALLLVAEVTDNKLKVLHEEQRIPRLGQGVDESKHLSRDAMDRVVKALNEFQEITSHKFPSLNSVQVTATSAVRDASNRSDFLEIVQQRTGLKVQVLSGHEEAFYTFKGALSVVENISDNENIVIDIGGGSTEIAVGSREIQDRYSFDIGCVRFTERYLQDDPPTQTQIGLCRQAIQNTFREYEFKLKNNASLIGVAGTVTSLAFIDKKLETYDSSVLAGHEVSVRKIVNYIRQLQEWPSKKLLKQYTPVMRGRADIFLAGLLILEVFMKKYGLTHITTSTGGIRHGVILDG